MRYLFLLLLAGCTATNWTKQSATPADADRDYEECRQIAKPDPAIAAIAGAFGAAGVFVGVNITDSKIRSCMLGRGWTGDGQGAQPVQAAQPSQGTQPGQGGQPVQVMQPVQGAQPTQPTQP